MGLKKFSSEFPGLYIIKPDVFGDSRGFFLEVYNQKAFSEIGLEDLEFVQDNLSRSSKGVLRGLHFQIPPYTQGKLVTVFEGSVLDVAVDIRVHSPTYGKAFSYEIRADEPTFVYIPEGFAHGFQVLSDTCLFYYKCTNFYNKQADQGIRWDDPALAIPWQDIPPILSPKDLEHPNLAEYESPFQEYIKLPASDSIIN